MYQNNNAQNLQNTEDLVIDNQVTAQNNIFRQIFSKLLPDWLQQTFQSFVSFVHQAPVFITYTGGYVYILSEDDSVESLAY